MSKPTKKKAKRYYSRKQIIDEFTRLKISRQRKHQLLIGICFFDAPQFRRTPPEIANAQD